MKRSGVRRSELVLIGSALASASPLLGPRGVSRARGLVAGNVRSLVLRRLGW
jgi:hypothetical protein